MKHSEVLSRYVNTGEEIPEEQYNRLTPSLKKSYLRMRGVAGNYFEWEFKIISDDERIKFIEKKGKKLDSNEIYYLLELSQRKDDIATKIIEKKGEGLTENDVKILLKYSVNKDDIISKIFQIRGNKIQEGDMEHLLEYSSNKNLMATKIIQIKGEELNFKDIDILVYYSENKYEISTKIIQIKGEKLNVNDIGSLINKNILNNDLNIINYNILKIIEAKGEKLTDREIYILILRSDKRELIKKTLLQNGINYKLINHLINRYNENNGLKNDLKIPLIPDNYQSMLNEIKRIKEIMK